MEDHTKGAILQRDKTSWALKPRTPLGLLAPADLERLGSIAARHGVETVKMTSGQRFILLGVPQERLAALRDELGPLGELCRNYVQACPGLEHCRFAVQDALGMGARLEGLIFGREYPSKVKLGVSACPFCCGESQVRDLGLVGRRKGWWLYVGGNSGAKPRLADLLARDLTDDQAVDLAQRFLAHYAATCKGQVRTARFMQQTSIEELRRNLGVEEID